MADDVQGQDQAPEPDAKPDGDGGDSDPLKDPAVQKELDRYRNELGHAKKANEELKSTVDDLSKTVEEFKSQHLSAEEQAQAEVEKQLKQLTKENQALAEERDPLRSAHLSSVRRNALLAAGLQGSDEQLGRLERLVTGETAEEIQGEVSSLREEFPALFQSEPPPSRSTSPPGRPTGQTTDGPTNVREQLSAIAGKEMSGAERSKAFVDAVLGR